MKRFLIIDEITENMLGVKSILGEMRISEVTTLEDSTEGLGIIEAKRIECVITSWDCKKMPGRVFVQKLRSVPSQKFLPLIIYSHRIRGEEMRLLNELGGINLLGAPIDRAALSALIKKLIEQEEKISPEMKSIRLAYGLYGAKQWDQAIEMLQPLATQSATKAEATALLATILFEKNDFDAAKSQIDLCLAEKPQHVLANQLKARLAAKLGNHQEAISSLVQLLDRCPEMLSILDTLGHAYKNSNQLEEAKKTFQSIMKIDRTSNAAKSGLGEIAFIEGDFDLATELLQDSENTEEIARNLNNLGIALTAKSEFEKAIESYTNAIRIFAKSKQINLLFYNLGLAYSKKGDFAAAYETLGQACLLDPKNQKTFAAFVRVTRTMTEKSISYDPNLAKNVKEAVKSDQAA